VGKKNKKRSIMILRTLKDVSIEGRKEEEEEESRRDD
jgi:hypothetical protein